MPTAQPSQTARHPALGAAVVHAGGAGVRFAAENAERVRRVEGVAYSGGVVTKFGVRMVVDLATAKWSGPIAMLIDHGKDGGTGTRVGFCNDLRIENDQLVIADGRMLDNEEARRIVADADAGFPFKLSIWMGDDTQWEHLPEGRTAKVNGRLVAGPLEIARHATIEEITFTAVAVDTNTKAAVLARLSGMDKGMTMATDTAPETLADDAETPSEEQLAADGMIAIADLTPEYLREHHPDLVAALVEGAEEAGEGADAAPVTASEQMSAPYPYEERLAAFEKLAADRPTLALTGVRAKMNEEQFSALVESVTRAEAAVNAKGNPPAQGDPAQSGGGATFSADTPAKQIWDATPQVRAKFAASGIGGFTKWLDNERKEGRDTNDSLKDIGCA